MKMFKTLIPLAMSALMSISSAAMGADLVIGSKYKPSNLDPNFSASNDDASILRHIFEGLIYQNADLKLVPELAESWEPIDDTTWEFRLREGVKFHDGSDFTAEDVVFSIERMRNAVGSSTPYTAYVNQIDEIEIVDPHTLRMVTHAPHPLLPYDIAATMYVSHEAASGMTTEDFNNGQNVIGTGPYKFVSWQPGSTVVLQRNEDYWGERQSWDNITLRTIESNATRVAALLAGDVDLIDFVPARDVETIKNNGFAIHSIPAARSNFLAMDHTREETPFITDHDGGTIGNPLLDRKVRQALSLAIDRNVITERILHGYADPAAQMFPDDLAGASPNLKPLEQDLEEARRLLEEAGYPEGFKLTLQGSSDRYPGDAESIQVIAQMWAQIGVDTTPEALPWNVFAPRASQGEYSIAYQGASGAEVSSPMRNVLHTRDREHGFGATNRGQYSNEQFDTMLEEALTKSDDDERNRLLGEAMEFVMEDVPIIPLYHFHHVVAVGDKIADFKMHPRGWTRGTQAEAAQ